MNIKGALASIEDVEKEIAHLNNVNAVYDVTGEWDAIIIAKFKSREEMDFFVKKLRKWYATM